MKRKPKEFIVTQSFENSHWFTIRLGDVVVARMIGDKDQLGFLIEALQHGDLTKNVTQISHRSH